MTLFDASTRIQIRSACWSYPRTRWRRKSGQSIPEAK